MKRTLFLFLTMVYAISSVATNFPVISSEENQVWYLIRFSNGGGVFAATADGAQISVAAADCSDAQLWKITGDNVSGYAFTNKLGYTLSVSSAAKEQMVSAGSVTGAISRFAINVTSYAPYSGAFEIQPIGDTTISMNMFGGPGANRGVGFWTSADINNPVRFVSELDYKMAGKISIIPYPAQLNVVKEGTLSITSLNAVVCPCPEVQWAVDEFVDRLSLSSGHTLVVKEGSEVGGDGEIQMLYDAELPSEGYTLDVADNGIVIKASAPAGFFYALQTLKQLLPREYFNNTQSSNALWSIPFVSIVDEPEFGHRGFMNDISRHFFDKDEVKRILDIMALYKMNLLHWHLTDDQGWRIEIPEYPLLTEVGAVRSGSFTNPGDGTKFFDDTEYGRGMYYTQDDLREIVAYAKARNIDILPEIDMPGHMVAAVTAYPYLSCDSTKKYTVRLDSGISEDVLNIGDDRVIDFIKCVLDNVAGIFPYPYIHIGGDECPTTQWATNEACLQRVQQEGLSGVEQLQSWLVEEIGTYMKEKHGKDIVVWDELLSHWNDNNEVKPVIMAWNNINKSAEAANRGFKSIISPYQNLYLDFMQVPADKTLIDEPYYGGWGDSHVNTIEEVYNINPVSALSGKEEYCVGVQGNLWAETLNDNVELEYQMLPRLLALAETGWLPSGKKDWSVFYRRLQSHDEILDALGYTYAKHYIEPAEKSNYEAAMEKAYGYLLNSVRGGVGYPSAELYDALEDAYDAAKTEESVESTARLVTAVAGYESADIVQPQAGRKYSIVSASTYYKKQYKGSSMYENNGSVRFHYTPQVEPEELWQFEVADGGYIIRSACSGNALTMSAYNGVVAVDADDATLVRIDKATVASGGYEYIPGVVTISSVDGYNAAANNSVKRLYAEADGLVYAKDEPALCYPGTWYIMEINDFTAQLDGLCRKCESWLRTAEPGAMGQPSQEALDYLQQDILQPARAALASGGITEEIYNGFVELYNEFLLMPRTSIMDALDEGCYYYIRSAWFPEYYAMFNLFTMRVEPKEKGEGNGYLWSVRKNPDGTVYLYNKVNGRAAKVATTAADQMIRLGEEQPWTLEERTLDGQSGVCIINSDGTNAWYINPDVWKYVLTKPFWGACIWSFEKSDVAVETSVDSIEADVTDVPVVYYDLQGRIVEVPTKGIYITNQGEKIIVE